MLSDGARIEHRRVCSKDGKEVPCDEVVKGYELVRGRVRRARPRTRSRRPRASTRQADRRRATSSPASEIDPIFFDKTYYVGCARRRRGRLPAAARGAGARPAGSAIGRFTFHDREYLVARAAARRGAGAAHDALPRRGRRGRRPRPAEAAARTRPSARSRWRASSSSRCRPSSTPTTYEDTYREAVLDLIKRKAKGEEI